MSNTKSSGVVIEYRVLGGVHIGTILQTLEDKFGGDRLHVVSREESYGQDIVHASDIIKVLPSPSEPEDKSSSDA